MKVSPLSELPVGKAVQVNYNHRGVLVIRTKTGLSAVGLKCTHWGCNVYWSEEKRAILCPCHAGVFDANGNVLSGPPPKPLPRYEVRVIDDVVFIAGGA